jgi:5-methylcytosine-specific restriction endonuclease McrA
MSPLAKRRTLMTHPIHQKALEAASRFKRAEADLIAILQEVENERVFLSLGYTSLFSYSVGALGLSESVAYNFVTVARKAREVPVLQSAIQNGDLSVSKARKIAPVLTLAPEEWIEKAKTLPSRRLEEEVARVLPREAAPERLKPVSEDRVELRMGISKALEEKLRRVQDLESQRTGRAASMEETLEAMVDIYLEVKDPVKRAERILKRGGRQPVTGQVGSKSSENHSPIPAAIRHQIQLRDGGRCTHVNPQGSRCENRRWLDVHHVLPRSEGGTNALGNLATLCSAHHRWEHRRYAQADREIPNRPSSRSEKFLTLPGAQGPRKPGR